MKNSSTHRLVPYDCGMENVQYICKTDDSLREKLRGRAFCVLKNDVYISRKLCSGEYWEEWMFDILQKFHRPNTSMIDIGAHIGTTTLLMQEIVDATNVVYSFEPIFHQLIRMTLELNNIHNVHLIPAGAGEITTTIDTTIKHWGNETNFGASCLDRTIYTGEGYDYFGDVPVQIPIIRLDDFTITESISVIKIDVEGMEVPVLNGMMNLIIRNRPSILIEVWQHSLESFVQSATFIKITQELNYTFLRIPEGYFDFVFVPNEYFQ